MAVLVEFDPRYLAGFFDGEGSVGIYDRGQGYYVLVVSLAQSGKHGETILKALQSKYGGYVGINKGPGKTMWKWNIAANKAKVFLDDIAPYLVVKKDEVYLSTLFQTSAIKRNDNPTAQRLAAKVKQLKHDNNRSDEITDCL